MSETRVRELFAAAASDEVLGQSTVDLDAVIRRERRSIARQRGASLVTVVVLAVGAVVTVPGLVARWKGTGPPAPPQVVLTEPVPTSDPAPTPPRTAAEGKKIAETVLLEIFDSVTPMVPFERDPTLGKGTINGGAQRKVGGHQVAGVSLWAQFRPAAAVSDNPCPLNPARTRGPNDPERGTNECRRYPQDDGTVVWVHSYRPSDNPRDATLRKASARQTRLDGSTVGIVVVYFDGGKATLPDYPDALLVKAVTDPRVMPVPQN